MTGMNVKPNADVANRARPDPPPQDCGACPAPSAGSDPITNPADPMTKPYERLDDVAALETWI